MDKRWLGDMDRKPIQYHTFYPESFRNYLQTLCDKIEPGITANFFLNSWTKIDGKYLLYLRRRLENYDRTQPLDRFLEVEPHVVHDHVLEGYVESLRATHRVRDIAVLGDMVAVKLVQDT